jgi:SAM-dependent methyltransferase
LPFPDGNLDFVVSTLSLHHWPNPAQAFQEIYRVLKPGGQFLVFDLRRDARRFIYGIARFATAVVVPLAIRRIGEPFGSFLAAYTPGEARGFGCIPAWLGCSSGVAVKGSLAGGNCRLLPLIVNSLIETNLGMPYPYLIHRAFNRPRNEDLRPIPPKTDAI